MLFGIPERDLNKAWTNYNVITTSTGQSPLLSVKDSQRTDVNLKSLKKKKKQENLDEMFKHFFVCRKMICM